MFNIKDVLVLPGGSDIDPSIYKKENYKSHISEYSMERDKREIALYKAAVKKGKPVFGICRGLQLISALNGLSLIQHMGHPSSHLITVRDEDMNFTKEILVNNAHHQCVWTENKLEGDNFVVYGYTNLSKNHHYQEDEIIHCTVEPEIIWFPETKSLGVQFHPEWMSACGDVTYYDNNNYLKTLDYLQKLANKLF